jgi:D-beta-D-heptose 7-phosphate kinase / D-beta-D-heptose 1-phosphate adenosyltransferase
MSILVLGDYIIDEYWSGTASRLSPEAPVPVINDIKRNRSPGGAASVALNLKNMGSDVRFISQSNLGEDSLLESLERSMLACDQTPTKIRIIADNHVICRIDSERYQGVMFDQSWISVDTSICVLSDYGKGFLMDSQAIIDHCNDLGIRTVVDPKNNWMYYSGCWLLKSNAKELQQQLGQNYNIRDLNLICSQLASEYAIQNLVVTLGDQGLYAWNHQGGYLIPSSETQIVDVTGAGDVVTAALVHYLDRGHDLRSAAIKANTLAGISVSKRGAYVLQPQDLTSVDDRVVFTNGCFDILHRGHIDYLRKSRELGTHLIVGLNSDSSVRDLKGVTRPVNRQEDRKALLESLEFVDEVIIFDEPTPYRLISEIRPDILTKGGDYTIDQVVGNDLVKQVVIIPLTNGYSTTSILEKKL